MCDILQTHLIPIDESWKLATKKHITIEKLFIFKKADANTACKVGPYQQ